MAIQWAVLFASSGSAAAGLFMSERATAFAQLLTRSDQSTVTGQRPAIFVEALLPDLKAGSETANGIRDEGRRSSGRPSEWLLLIFSRVRYDATESHKISETTR